MTAVAVQSSGAQHQQYNPRQSPHSPNMSAIHQPRLQSNAAVAGPPNQRQEPLAQNGIVALMNPRPAVSNDPVLPVNGHGQTNGYSAQNSTSARRGSLQGRPNSAPYGGDGAADSSQDEGNRQIRAAKKRPKSLLYRSKSDAGPRGDESQTDEEIPDWGARHGFDMHYAEEFVSQLANVSHCLSVLASFFSGIAVEVLDASEYWRRTFLWRFAQQSSFFAIPFPSDLIFITPAFYFIQLFQQCQQ